MEKVLNSEQVSFITTRFKDNLYHFYQEEIGIHTLGDSSYFSSLEVEVNRILNGVKNSDNKNMESSKLRNKLLLICNDVFRKYQSREIYFNDKEWEEMVSEKVRA